LRKGTMRRPAAHFLRMLLRRERPAAPPPGPAPRSGGEVWLLKNPSYITSFPESYGMVYIFHATLFCSGMRLSAQPLQQKGPSPGNPGEGSFDFCLCQNLRSTAQLLGDVQHMVTHTLEVGEDLRVEDAALVAALAVLHAVHVIFPEAGGHVVDGLLQLGS